jgi:hypothetical protein
MILYHGSTVEVRNPQIIVSELGRDFGPAFYTTGIQDQAVRWAIRRAKFARKGGKVGTPAIVYVYEFDEVSARSALKCKSYSGVSIEWLDMVVACRSRPLYRHGYDLMTGKVANDNVGETVSYVVAGVMPKEMALEQLKFQKINDQVAFCSQKSLQFLKFVKSYELEVQR